MPLILLGGFMKFRNDINGLRAIAVMAVVLFHFNSSWIQGGFAGVDVFFVISGFLMTAIIFRGLENNNFSIINFYVARANRIVPALSVVCLVLLVFGWFYLYPADYRNLGKHVAGSLSFLSNVLYWKESGYFSDASHSKWLLHTWSLSVEWQFYIIYPVVLVLLNKFISLSNIKRLLVLGTICGFILSAYATYRWRDPAYFLFPTRAWEMMMGGLAFIYPLQNLKENTKKYLEWIGVALILASYIFISKSNYWPGYLALIPVLGGYLIIQANRNDSIITNNVVTQKIGLWSYSIYLWHWPVVVIGYTFKIPHWEWIGIPLSLVLGYCSYTFIEKVKFPKLSTISFKTIFMLKPMWMVLSLCFMSLYVYIDDGLISLKYEPKTQVVIKNIITALDDWDYPNGNVYYGDAPLRVIKSDSTELQGENLFIGDSLIEQYYPKIKTLVDNHQMPTTVFFTEGGCLPIKGIENDVKACGYLYKVSDYIKDKKFNNIVFGGAYFKYFSDESTNFIASDNLHLNNKKDREVFITKYFKPFIDELKKSGKNVYFMLPTPVGHEFDGKFLLDELIHHKQFVVHDEAYYRTQYKELYKIIDSLDIQTIDPLPYLCNSKQCNVMTKDGQPLHKDDMHLRPWYVIQYASYFDKLASKAS